MKKLLSAASVLLLALFMTACAAHQDAEPSVSTGAANAVIGIRGSITSRAETDSGITMLVEGEIMADTQYDKASVRVMETMTVVQDTQGQPVEKSALTVGTTVEVVFKGPVAESYPVQGTADTVRILPP